MGGGRQIKNKDQKEKMLDHSAPSSYESVVP